MNKNISFAKWIKRFENEDSAIGDLAYDIKRDNRFPKKAKRRNTIFNYLVRYACKAALDTFEYAYKEYDTEKQN